MTDIQIKWPSLIAHRGASAYAVENTLTAFKLLNQYEVKWFECDVTLSRDNEPVIFHDKTLSRLTPKKRQVNACTWQYLQNIPLTNKLYGPDRIPHLGEMMQLVLDSHLSINIELKPNHYHAALLVEKVGNLLMEYTAKARIELLISSFDHDCLSYFKQKFPRFHCGFLMEKYTPESVKVAEKLDCASYHCDYRHLKAEDVKVIHERQMKCYVYTVNNLRLADKLFAWGVDGIFSDYPDLLS